MTGLLNAKNHVLEQKTEWVTSDFGPRSGGYHYGIDLVRRNVTYNTLDWIIAFDDGEVDIAEYNSSYGNNVRIKHNNTYHTRYAHMRDLPLVKKGDKVKKGQRIGYMGNTGASQGAHLHFEIWENLKIRIDPKPFMLGDKNFGSVPPIVNPPVKPPEPPPITNPDTKPKTHIVKKGENLTRIAKMYGTTWRILQQLNNIPNASLIFPGQVLKLP